ncbi:AraC family transcriptional regulator [Gracilibacillus salinarum]|uniref:AraC family transcriptional regulator n=1 Tax=Gracilibacillus salinarum TaxID=2932255 RepID=A0ABY4GR84_9BACI|nr:AraC family transcriptional regulator [Gracilibacillus salinarum]UOQ86751.1 AraC family transcriptional regulator [Gracilibacillus salinarum]
MIVEQLAAAKPFVDVPAFSIQHKRDNHTIKEFHSHQGFEMVWVKGGEAQFIFEEKVFHLKKGHVLCFKGSELHKVRLPDDQGYERVVIMFTDDLFPDTQPIYQEFKELLDKQPTPHFYLQIDTQGYESFSHIIRKLLQEEMSPEKWQQQHALNLYVTELLLFLSRRLHAETNEINQQHLTNPIQTQEKILREINLIWNTTWQLEDLAARLHFNKYYLCHFFKKEFGMTIQQYVLQRRMYEAKKLLVETNTSIADIAVQIGFSTASNFIRCFKKYQQVTPKQFRNQGN